MPKRSKGYRRPPSSSTRTSLHPARGGEIANEPPRPSSTAPSRSPCGSGSTPARPTRWSAAPSACRTAPARPPASSCSRPATRPRPPSAAGADKVGSDDLIPEITDGFLDFDAAIATPDQMAKVGRIARDPGPAWSDAEPEDRHRHPRRRQGRQRHQGRQDQLPGRQAVQPAPGDRQGVLQRPSKLVENYAAALDEVLRAKPSAAKGSYLKKVTFSTTMGPGIPVDSNRTRNLLEDERAGLVRGSVRSSQSVVTPPGHRHRWPGGDR